jgi:hypothetical protein
MRTSLGGLTGLSGALVSGELTRVPAGSGSSRAVGLNTPLTSSSRWFPAGTGAHSAPRWSSL